MTAITFELAVRDRLRLPPFNSAATHVVLFQKSVVRASRNPGHCVRAAADDRLIEKSVIRAPRRFSIRQQRPLGIGVAGV